MLRNSPSRLATVFASFLLAACAGDEIAGPSPSGRPLLEGEISPAPPEQASLCKIGPEGTSATFDIVTDPAGVGYLPSGATVTVQAQSLGMYEPAKCALIWAAADPADPTVTLTITERPQTGLELYQITSFSMDGTIDDFSPTSMSHSVRVNYSSGALVFFKNKAVDVPPPPPPAGGQGCTPGYWKQEQHFGNWTAPYAPSGTFSSAFGVDAFPGLTLLQVLDLQGGNLYALGRHAVAALLNAASPDVSYDMSTADIINAFSTAYSSGSKETIENTKNVFEGFNEQGCPLGVAW